MKEIIYFRCYITSETVSHLKELNVKQIDILISNKFR